MKKIITILGTRPEIIKLSSVIPLLDQKFENIIIHTGQHYSYNMDKIFFGQLRLREANYNLDVGSGTHGHQTGTMMKEIEKIVLEENPDIILVQGDTNSTLAGALVAAKLHIPLAHIEAGYRSKNMKMPEEINRIITDRLSQYLFVGIQEGMENLQNEGINERNMHLIGNTAIDALRRNEQFSNDSILHKIEVEKSKYVLVTLHRADNTDNKENLQNIAEALNHLSKKTTLVFPIHPRTKKALARNNITLSENIISIDPLGYLDFISLMKHARFIMTDSGGIQEESVELNVPCLILRNETEEQKLLQLGKTQLTTTQSEEIIRLSELLIDNDDEIQRIKDIPYTGMQGVAEEIVNILDKNGT